MKNKKINFLFLKLILNLNFLISVQDKIKKGSKIPICLNIKINGNLI